MNETTGNPYLGAAAEGAAWEELRRIEWAEQLRIWNQYLEGCREFLEKSAHARLLLAAEAVQQWGWNSEIKQVNRSETHTGRVYFKTSLILMRETTCHAWLEFICSPTSSILASEAQRLGEKRRWKKASLHAPNMADHLDEIIRDFLRWGMSH